MSSTNYKVQKTLKIVNIAMEDEHSEAGIQEEKKEVKLLMLRFEFYMARVLGYIITEEKGEAEPQKKEQDFGGIDFIAK